MELTLNEILALSLCGNTVEDYMIFIVVTLAIYLFFSVVITFTIKKLAKLAKRTKNDIDDVIIQALRKIKWPIFLIVLLVTIPLLLNVHEYATTFSKYAIIILITYEVIKVISTLIDYVTAKAVLKEGENQFLKPLGTIIKIALWIIGVVLVLSNLGYDVTSLIAGLGIGGIAIALALQNVLGDIFSSLSIYFDKPFKPGDFITMGTYRGTVKSVGIKTTRLESMEGEELVIPNNKLVSAEVQNYGKVKKRRASFEIGVTYDTPLTKVKKAKKIIKDVITKIKDAEADRIHFGQFGDSALVFEVVFYAKTSEYREFMDIKEKINLEIMKQFEGEGIEFAFPTQTVHLVK